MRSAWKLNGISVTGPEFGGDGGAVVGKNGRATTAGGGGGVGTDERAKMIKAIGKVCAIHRIFGRWDSDHVPVDIEPNNKIIGNKRHLVPTIQGSSLSKFDTGNRQSAVWMELLRSRSLPDLVVFNFAQGFHNCSPGPYQRENNNANWS